MDGKSSSRQPLPARGRRLAPDTWAGARRPGRSSVDRHKKPDPESGAQGARKPDRWATSPAQSLITESGRASRRALVGPALCLELARLALLAWRPGG